MTWLIMSCSFCVTPACASGNVPISLSIVCALGPNQWAIHVPLGELKTERWVPADSMVCQLVERIRFLRPTTAPKAGRLLLSRPRGRFMLIRRLRAALQDVAAVAGITARIVPHQFRHTYGTEMLRAGALVTKPAHDFGVPRNHPTGSPARVPLGSLSSQTLGAISDQLLWFPTSSRFVELDRIININGRPARSANVPPQRPFQRPTS